MATFSTRGRVEYNAKVDKFKNDLLREADRIESGNNPMGPQEITQQHVVAAEVVVRHGLIAPPQPKKGFLDYAALIATPGAGFLGGWSTSNLDSGWGVAGIAASIVVAFASELYKDSRQKG